MDAVELQPPSEEIRAAIDGAVAADRDERGRRLREVVVADPLCLEGWARLGDDDYESGDDVGAYAFYRVGYHRGLDLLRSAGWRPDRQAPWSRPGNRGFLMSLYGLMRAAAAIGEGVEARRCREFLLDLDPDDALGVGPIKPRDLSRRLDV